MNIVFKNTKEHKHCQNLIKALIEVGNFGKTPQKDLTRSLFMSISDQCIELSSSIVPLHKGRTQSSCLITLLSDTYNIKLNTNLNAAKCFEIKADKLVCVLKPYQNNVVLLQLSFEEECLQMQFELDGGAIKCQLKIEYSELVEPWPRRPQEESSNVSEDYVKMVKISSEEFNQLTFDQKCTDLWIQLIPAGLVSRTMRNKQFRSEEKILLEKVTNQYEHTTLMAKLKAKNYLNLETDIFKVFIQNCLKTKATINFAIKIIYDHADENVIRFTYLVLSVEFGWGSIKQIINCFMGETTREIEFQANSVPAQRNQVVGTNGINSIMIKEETLMSMNKQLDLRYNSIAAEDNREVNAFRERKLYGKLEELDQTVTRKFKFQ